MIREVIKFPGVSSENMTRKLPISEFPNDVWYYKSKSFLSVGYITNEGNINFNKWNAPLKRTKIFCKKIS